MYLYTNQNSKLVLTPFNNVLTSSLDITDSHAISLISRMTASGETPTLTRQLAINNCIVALKANNLFQNQFDVLVTTRSHGRNSAKMNWIKNNSNASEFSGGGVLSFSTDIGYQSDGLYSYLDTNYTPSTVNNLLQLNDGCFIVKVEGIISNYSFHGASNIANTSFLCMSSTIPGGYSRMNSSAFGGGFLLGWNCITRNNSTTMNIINASTSTPYTISSIAVPDKNMHILHLNYTGQVLFAGSTEINELYACGKSITLSQFITFQSIMNNYFSTF